MNKNACLPKDISDAQNFIKILDSVRDEKQGLLRLIMECVLLGASIVQGQLTAQSSEEQENA